MIDETRVVDTTNAVDVEVTPVEVPTPPPQEEKIIVMQLITPSTCSFICLSAEEGNEKFEFGIMRR